MKTVLVIGAGFMGSGIAQVCAQTGCRVMLMDINAEALEKAIGGIKWSLGKFFSKGFLKEAPESCLERISTVTDLNAAAETDWVIEAAFENEDLKKEIFEELDRLAPSHIPLATNTSSIPISRLAEFTGTPERVLGLHFFGPVPFMGLVEVIKGEKTSEQIFNRGADFVKSLGKTPVKVHQRHSRIRHEPNIWRCFPGMCRPCGRWHCQSRGHRYRHETGIWLEYRTI